MTGSRLERDIYTRSALIVAKDCIGKLLVHEQGNQQEARCQHAGIRETSSGCCVQVPRERAAVTLTATNSLLHDG